jgi:hypothetical protein
MNLPNQQAQRFLNAEKAIRTISGANYNGHTDPLFRKLKILKLDDIYMNYFLRPTVRDPNIRPWSYVGVVLFSGK